MGFLVELDRVTIERLIEEKERHFEQLDGELSSLADEIKRLKASIADKQVQLIPTPETTPSGRNKRGETARIIEEYMKSNKLRPLSLNEISKATSTKYGTAYRVLNEFSKEGKVKNKNGEWSWIDL